MNKLTDDQLRILERKFWMKTGVVEQGQRETIFDYVGFARSVIAASQEINSKFEAPQTISEAIERLRHSIASDDATKKRFRFLTDQSEREELSRWLMNKAREVWPCPNYFSVEAHTEEYNMFLRFYQAAKLLSQNPEPKLIPVSERPILKSDPFNDELGRCWCGSKAFVDNTGDCPIDYPASWEFRDPSPQDDCLLPANAIPQPEILK